MSVVYQNHSNVNITEFIRVKFLCQRALISAAKKASFTQQWRTPVKMSLVSNNYTSDVSCSNIDVVVATFVDAIFCNTEVMAFFIVATVLLITSFIALFILCRKYRDATRRSPRDLYADLSASYSAYNLDTARDLNKNAADVTRFVVSTEIPVFKSFHAYGFDESPVFKTQTSGEINEAMIEDNDYDYINDPAEGNVYEAAPVRRAGEPQGNNRLTVEADISNEDH